MTVGSSTIPVVTKTAKSFPKDIREALLIYLLWGTVSLKEINFTHTDCYLISFRKTIPQKSEAARWRNLWMALKEQIKFNFLKIPWGHETYNLFWSLPVSDPSGLCNLKGFQMKRYLILEIWQIISF